MTNLKKIIGVILIILFFGAIWAGLTVMFYTGGMPILISIIMPLGIYVVAILFYGFILLLEWLFT
jgi:hypothetical protein